MITFQFEQYATGVSAATRNSMDMNNHLEFVEIHTTLNPNFLFYGAGRIDGNQAVFHENGASLTFGTLGISPRISINDDHLVIATFIGGVDLFRYLYCATGTFRDGAVTWFPTTLKTYCSTPEALFDTAVNNTWFVLAYTYRNLFTDGGAVHTYVKLGKVEASTGDIQWQDDGWNDAGRGTIPTVTMNEAGTVIVVAQSVDSPNKLYYKVGHVAGRTVAWDCHETWIAEIDVAGIIGISVAMNDGDEVLLAYIVGNRAYCMQGALASDRKSIRFTTPPTAFAVGQHDGVTVQVSASCGSGKALISANDGTFLPGLYAGVGSMCRNWIGNNMKAYGRRKLRDFVLPGSHDAAMSKAEQCSGPLVGSFGANACNTQTQTLRVADQLEQGIRYFDLRPLVGSDGKIGFGHFSSSTFGYIGCQGEGLDDVLDAVAGFMANTRRELVILAFSHFLDLLRRKENIFEVQDFNALIAAIRQKLGAHLLQVCQPGSLADLTLEHLTAQGSVVLPIIDCNNSLPAGCQGIFVYKTRKHSALRIPDTPLSIFDNFSDTDDLDTMVARQLKYFADTTDRSNSDLHLFSWTLTQSALNALSCALPNAQTILDLGRKANAALPGRVRDAINTGKFSATNKPNILLADACDTCVTDVCIMLNNL